MSHPKDQRDTWVENLPAQLLQDNIENKPHEGVDRGQTGGQYPKTPKATPNCGDSVGVAMVMEEGKGKKGKGRGIYRRLGTVPTQAGTQIAYRSCQSPRVPGRDFAFCV